jgi:hypothetical protein
MRDVYEVVILLSFLSSLRAPVAPRPVAPRSAAADPSRFAASAVTASASTSRPSRSLTSARVGRRWRKSQWCGTAIYR